MAKAQDDGSLKEADHINQIRDILLGPQKRDYDQKFDSTLADIRKSREESRQRSDELEGALKAEIATLQRALDQQTRQLSTTIQEQTAKLQQLISQNEEKIRSVKEQLSKDIESHVAALRDGKVSRDVMAELLQELALKLKGVEIVGELRKATRKGQGD